MEYGCWSEDHVKSVEEGGHRMIVQSQLSPILALVAGILILIRPRLLNYVIAIYLIVFGLLGLLH